MTSEPPGPARGRAARAGSDLAAPVTRAILSLWAREGKWAEIALAGVSMSPLIPDGSRLTVRFGRQGIARGDVILYATEAHIVAHRVLRLGKRGPRWGCLKVKGDPVRTWEAVWIPVEDVLGRVVGVRSPGGSAVLLNTLSGRIANRVAATLSGLVGGIEGKARSALGAGTRLTLTPALLGLLQPVYRFGSRSPGLEAGLLLRAEERFLIAAARARMTADDERRLRQALRREIPWGRLPAAASALGLAAALYRNLSQPGLRSRVPPDVLAALGRSAHASACQMAIQLEALRTILSEMRRDGIEPILLKGAALALTLYEQPALRSMQDLDLLVDPGQVDLAFEAARRAGFRPIAASRSAAFYAGHHHTVPMIGGGGRVVLEIHRGLVPPEEGLRLDPAPFIERAVKVEARGSTYRVLAREDLILHACLHLSYCDRFVGRLRDLMDVHALVNHEERPLDWGLILGAAQRTDVCRSLYASLDLAGRLLGARVPPELLSELARGAGWDPLAERLLRAFARAGLFAGSTSDGLLPGPSARWLCGTLIKRPKWAGRFRDLVNLLAEA